MFGSIDTPLLITPGFAANWLQGPDGGPPPGPELPPRVYDAYLDFAWYPRVNQWLGGELGFRTGVWSGPAGKFALGDSWTTSAVYDAVSVHGLGPLDTSTWISPRLRAQLSQRDPPRLRDARVGRPRRGRQTAAGPWRYTRR